jgi:hypothetical protein
VAEEEVYFAKTTVLLSLAGNLQPGFDNAMQEVSLYYS